MDFPVLTFLILSPVAGAVLVLLLPQSRKEIFYPVAFAVSLVPLALAGYLVAEFDKTDAGFQFVEQTTWFTPWGVGWHVGVDGISLWLVALTAFLLPIVIVASTKVTYRAKQYLAAMLLLEAALIGVFLSLDLIVFFVFWEAMLIPMYLIIGVWGGERRIYAAVKFFIYTALGSTLMLAGILALGIIAGDQLGSTTFDYSALLTVDLTRTAQFWLFAAFALSFAIKVPIFPLHTWLPDAHVEAPTAGSVLLAGVLLKMGVYGFLRFNLPLFPEASVDLAPLLATLAVIGILYGAIVAIVQPDIKKLVAYSSVSHLGFVVLGMFALTSQGLQGGVIQSVNHGLTTGALFLLVGMIYERRKTRRIADYGGLAKVMPIFAGFFLFIAFASIGLPGLNGFIGEFLVLAGSYLSVPGWAIPAAFGVLLAAIYMLWAYERIFTGPVDKEENRKLVDLSLREMAILTPIAVLVLVIGLWPKPMLDRIEPSVERILTRVEATTDYDVPDFGYSDEVVEAGGD